jgi:hypothetical protein
MKDEEPGAGGRRTGQAKEICHLELMTFVTDFRVRSCELVDLFLFLPGQGTIHEVTRNNTKKTLKPSMTNVQCTHEKWKLLSAFRASCCLLLPPAPGFILHPSFC